MRQSRAIPRTIQARTVKRLLVQSIMREWTLQVSSADFARYSKVLHRLTADFVRAVPDDKWAFTPDPPGRAGRAPAPHRIGDGFAPFSKQLRHVVCVRSVYNAALATKKVDFRLCLLHVGVRTTRGDPSRSMERLCLTRRV